MKKIFIPLVIVGVVVTLVFAGCVGVTAPPEAPPTAPPEAPPTAPQTLKVGLVSPLTGPMAQWGVIMKRGMELWTEDVNARGGIEAGGVTYMISSKLYDDKGFVPAEYPTVARKAVLEDDCRILLTTSVEALVESMAPFLKEQGALNFTWGASYGLKPEWPHIIGAYTYWPQFHFTTLRYVAENYPEIKRVAFLHLESAFALEDRLWNLVGCEAAGLEAVYDEPIAAETVDWYPIISTVLATEPDLINTNMSPLTIPAIMEAAYSLGYTGKFAGNLPPAEQMLEKVPAEFIEGSFMNNPNLNDPAIVGDTAYRLWSEYMERYPGEWTMEAANAWFGLSTMLVGVERADSVDPMAIREALLATDPVDHPLLGESHWGGLELYGSNQYLMTPWYIGEVRNGVNCVVDLVPFADWYEAHKDVVLKYIKRD